MAQEKIKILHVDPEPHIGNLITLSLDYQKYIITKTYSARKALKKIRRKYI